MFAYCLNNPANCFDSNGNMPLPVPTIGDYYRIHKRVQYEVAEEQGYAIEVYVSGPLGKGYLDLYDAVNNEYYEVKSSLQADTTSTVNQMYKYDISQIKDWRFWDYDIPNSPQRGNLEISGSFQYRYWDISYRLYRSGLIVYFVRLNTEKYEQALAAAAVVASSAFMGYTAGIKARSGGRGITQKCID